MYQGEGSIKPGVYHLSYDACCLPARTGSFAYSQRLKCFVQCPRILLFRALEEHIFKEVRESLLLFRLVDDCGIKLKSQGNRIKARHILTNHLNAIGQLMIEIVGWKMEALLIAHVFLRTFLSKNRNVGKVSS